MIKLISILLGYAVFEMLDGLYQRFQGATHSEAIIHYIYAFVIANVAVSLSIYLRLAKPKTETSEI